MYYDDVARSEVTMDPNQLVKWIIFGTYSYEKGRPLLSDPAFDDLGDQLIRQWDNLDHEWKYTLNLHGGLNKFSTVCLTTPLPYDCQLEVEKLMEDTVF